MSVFDIQKFCISDGPGIRTTVFLKGCPLSCVWCHNPESKSVTSEIFYDTGKCIGCGRCADVCKNNCHNVADGTHHFSRKMCTACGDCAAVCPAKALEMSGTEMAAAEIINEVITDEVFFRNSGGGLTVSGGEPMLDFDFLYSLLTEAKSRRLHVCMETCGFAPADKYIKIMPLTDIFLYDYKETDPDRHKKYTGADNAQILSNLRMLDSMGAKTVLRCPIIPGLNDRDDHFEGIAELANSLVGILEINIEPYHPFGADKAKKLGIKYPLGKIAVPESETINKWLESIQLRTDISVKRA